MMKKKKLFIGHYNKSVIVTYVGVVMSVIGMAYIQNLKLALICLMIAGVCDMFDGAIARRYKRTDDEKQFGVEIDSLADTVSFVVFPVVLFVETVEHNTNVPHAINSMPLTIVVASIYVLAGITRLGWFNVHTANTETKAKVYTGLPVTLIAAILPVVYSISFILNLSNLIYYIVMTITAILFVSNISFKKPKKGTYVVLAILAVLMIIGICVAV